MYGKFITFGINIFKLMSKNTYYNNKFHTVTTELYKDQNQSLSVPLAQQSVNGTQQLLLGSPAQQSFIETRRSTDLNTAIDITDDISSTLIHTLDQDINGADNSSDVSESQSIDNKP